MTVQNSQMARLTETLLRKTRVGSIRWKRTDGDTTYLYAGENGIVLVDRRVSVAHTFARVRVLDERGETVDEYESNDANLLALYTAIEDQYRRIDSRIGRLLAEVESA